MPSAGLRRWVPAGAATLVFVLLAGLWRLDAGAYRLVIHAWGIAPFRFAFLDTDMVLSGLHCRARGIDVYAANPCDVLGRIYDYSPLWLALTHTGLAGLGPALVGPAVDGIFLTSLLLLPPGRCWRDTAVITLGCLSSATVFAMERGNTDLIILALAAGAAALNTAADGRPDNRRGLVARCVGYLFAVLAGLLKYYPLALLGLALRERPRRCAAIALAAAILLAACLAIDGAELRRALALIPTGSLFGDMFGARTLPSGLAHTQPAVLSPAQAMLLQATMILAACAIGGWCGFDAGLGADIARLTAAERAFLLAGALLVGGCFFTAQNIGYRAINLLAVLPAFAALRRVGQRRRLYGTGLGLTLALLWSQGWRFWLHLATEPPARLRIPGHPETGAAFVAGWLLREAGWWCLVTLLIACAVAAARLLPSGRAIERWVRRRRGNPHLPPAP